MKQCGIAAVLRPGVYSLLYNSSCEAGTAISGSAVMVCFTMVVVKQKPPSFESELNPLVPSLPRGVGATVSGLLALFRVAVPG